MTELAEFADVLGPLSSDAGSSAPTPPGSARVADGVGKITGIAGDAYEGASRLSRELALWSPANRSADRDIIPQKALSDARVRDTLRNDAFVRSGQILHQDNIVGGQFFLNSKPATKVLLGKEDPVWEGEFQEEVETLFTLWGESLENWVDASRRNTFSMMIRQGVGTYLATGELLAAVEWVRDDADMRAFNTAIRMIDLDRLSTPTLFQAANPFIVGGVEVNKRHVPVAYHVRKAHPEAYYYAEAYEWERIEARKPWGRPQVIHLFEQFRPNQTRGISELTAALKEMRMTKDFRDTVLQNAVVNATYAATIESDLDTASIFQRLGGGNMNTDMTREMEGLITSWIGAYLGAVRDYTGASDQFKLGGVRIPHLPPGSKLHINTPSKGGPLGSDLEKSLLRHIAAALNVSYEELSRDYSETNYSSARAAGAATWKFMQSRKALVADRFATLIFRLWLEEALNKNLITALPRKLGVDTAWFYEQPLAKEAITRCEWIGASRGQIDELKETQAAVLRMKYGLSTMEQESMRLGGDWRNNIKQMKREKEALGDDFSHPATTTDNTMNAAGGTPSEASEPAASTEFADILGGTLKNDFSDAVHPDPDKKGKE